MKVCTNCGREKPDSLFGPKKGNRLERKSECKECLSAKSRAYYLENRDRVLAYQKEYYKKNSQKIKSRAMNEYYKDPKSKIEKTNKRARENREKVNAWQRMYLAKRAGEDVSFRLRGALASRIRSAVKEQASEKAQKTMGLVGCSVSELRSHLESKFSAGMTWDNYGRNGWHIDHIKPCSLFDMADPEQQKECFNWSNLQPLWEGENIAKGNKYQPEGVQR